MRARKNCALGAAVTPVGRETLNDRVYVEIRNSILTGALAPGTELTLRGQADAVGTSLMPVRDSLRRLASEGGLELLPSRKFAVPVLTIERLQEVYRIRQLLEGEAVALAAKRMTQTQLDEACAIFGELEDFDATDSRQCWILDTTLHLCLYEAAGRACLLTFIQSLWLQLGPLRARVSIARILRGGRDPHRILLDALQRGDEHMAHDALLDDLSDELAAATAMLARRGKQWQTRSISGNETGEC